MTQRPRRPVKHGPGKHIFAPEIAGNVMVYGETGSGKTLTETTLLVQFLRINPSKTKGNF